MGWLDDCGLMRRQLIRPYDNTIRKACNKNFLISLLKKKQGLSSIGRMIG